jgi:hypothetical protein
VAEFQVVAVYPSGNRYAIRKPHAAFLSAESHRCRCELTLKSGEDWQYEIDVVGGKQGIDGVADLGYSEEEIESVRENVRTSVEKRHARNPQEFIDRAAADANEWAAQNVAEGGVCDFCCHLLGENVVTYTTDGHLVEDILIASPGRPEVGSGVATIVQDEYWAACPDCDPVVEQGDAAKLAAHVLDRADFERIGVPRERFDVAELEQLYVRFFERNPVRSLDDPRSTS